MFFIFAISLLELPNFFNSNFASFGNPFCATYFLKAMSWGLLILICRFFQYCDSESNEFARCTISLFSFTSNLFNATVCFLNTALFFAWCALHALLAVVSKASISEQMFIFEFIILCMFLLTRSVVFGKAIAFLDILITFL